VRITLVLFAFVLLHELGHSLAAIGYGIPVKDIVLLPIGGVARLERMPEKPHQELIVALAGPLVNVIFAAILFPVIVWSGFTTSSFFGNNFQPGLAHLLTFMFGANFSLAIFNMLPAFPLDGGRVLRATLGFFMTYQQATKVAVQVGRALALGLGLVAIIYQLFWLAFIAFFIFVVGSQEGQAVSVRSLLRRIQAGQVMTRHSVALSPYATVGQIAPMVIRSGQQSNFAILDPLNGNLLGVTSGQRVAHALAQGQRYQGITEIMQHAASIPIVAFTAPLDEVQAKLEATSTRVAAVYDGLNFRGLVSLEDIYQVFQFLTRHGTVPQSVA
jgi:Zn-dependent protease